MLDQETFLNRLAGFLARASGAQVVITAALPLAGGASRDSWRIDCTLDGAPRSFVLRRDPPTQMFADALSRADEYRLMAAAHAAGVCVAAVRYLCEDPEVLGGAFFLMDLVEGVSIGRTVVHAPELAAARTRLADEMAQQLALIHRMPADTLGFLPAPADGSPAASAIAGCYRMLIALGIEHPVFEYALRWLALHRPAEERIATLHGDFRIGNMLVGSPGLTAVIDWEFAHLGDPHEELGYGCLRDWRFGGALPYGGIATRERFIAAYEAAGGGPVNRDSMRWWEILGNVRWGIICLSQAERHLSGAERSVELASLGRRSAEMQLEALRLIHDAGLGEGDHV
jgi:aminoglycoside phosphotransferase (APT) family kinase protein